MNIVKLSISLFATIFIAVVSFAQVNIPIGTWRIHTAGRICKTIEKVGNKIFAASESGFIVFDKEDNTVKSLSKIDGFNGASISKLKYHAATSTLIIAYTDGNIDLLNDDVVTNLNDIKRSSITGSKKINNISIKGDLAYLSCAFGIVVLDLKKVEVKETYANIGTNGSQIEVFSSAFKGDSIFIVSSQGVKSGSTLSNYNLIDYSNWFSYSASNGIPGGTVFKSVGVINNHVFTATDKGVVYHLTGNQWAKDTSFVFPSESAIHVTSSNGKLHFLHPNKLISIDNNLDKLETVDLTAAADIVVESNTVVWFADAEKGIVSHDNGTIKSIYPNSPYYNASFRLRNFTDWTGAENIAVTTGGYTEGATPINSPYGIYLFRDGIWESYNETLGNFPQSLKDKSHLECFIESDYNSADSSLYIASFIGVVKFKRIGQGQSKTLVINQYNSSLTDLYGNGDGYFMFDVKFDSKSNFWAIGAQRSSPTSPTLFAKIDNVWQSFNFPEIGNLQRYPVELMVDKSDNKWIRYSTTNGGGILVFNEKYALGKRTKYLNDKVGEGRLPSMGVSCMATGKDGDVWIGTDKGVAVYYNPDLILTSTSFDATTPIYENRPLLRDKSIKCITIDGANRKWIGTNAGVWLFNEDGTQEVLNFNTDNSPLPSNNIYDIEIVKSTGEVFFATDLGLISYRGTATDPLIVNSAESGAFTAKVFPNPVTPEFSGYIGISGLPMNTNVKITDINGVLVYETQSNGGTATWNGVTYAGNRAETGIYLIFATNKEGMQTMVSKFSIIK